MLSLQSIKRLPVSVVRRFRKYHQLRQAAKRADCLLASYPKSGRTWLRYIMSNYLNEAHRVGADIDMTTTFKLVPNFDLDMERGVPAFESDPSTSDIPMVLVTHLRHNRLLFQKRPIVFLVRDPKDVMVSSYFHATGHKNRFNGDMSSFLADKSQGVQSLISYLNTWAKALKDHPHLVTSYERLQADPVATVTSVINFIGWDVLPEAVNAAVALSSFDSMRQSEISVGIPGHDYDRTDEKNLRMRRGVVGGFRESLNEEQVAYIDGAVASYLTADARSLLEKSRADVH